MPSYKKKFKIERLDELAECIFGYKTVNDLVGKTFTGEFIKQNDALKKYIDKDLTTKLKESETLKQCNGLKIPYDKLTELNIVNIFKNLLKRYTNYVLSSSWNFATKSPIYYITLYSDLETSFQPL